MTRVCVAFVVLAPVTTRRQAQAACALIFALAISAMSAEAALARTPLNDLGAGSYLDQFQGGLFPGGSNVAPEAHAAEGLRRAAAIRPLNTLGEPDANGKYVLVSIGMSNTTQEFCGANQVSACRPWTFMGQAAAEPAVDHTSLFIVNGAAGGKSAAYWDSPTDPDYNRVLTDWLTPNGLSEKQVQAAWVKVANPGPAASLPNANSDAYRLVTQMGDIGRALKVRYPNLQQVFFSSRIYAGYATTQLNPEPYAYESGFAVKWLVEAQINQMNGGAIHPLAGNLDYRSGVAPWITWGPYLWADGLNARSDGLIWERSDLANDGTHPSQAGQEKVGSMLLDLMLNSPFTRPWFLSPIAGDYNGDGDVDAADYVVWRETLGQTGAGLAADGNGNDEVDAGDYDVWRAHFGQTAIAGSAGAAHTHTGISSTSRSNTAVPEPRSAWLFLAGLISTLGARRGRKAAVSGCQRGISIRIHENLRKMLANGLSTD